MKRVVAHAVLAGLITAAVLLFVMGMTAGSDVKVNIGVWLLWEAVIIFIVMGITFVVSWLDYDEKRPVSSENVRSIRRSA